MSKVKVTVETPSARMSDTLRRRLERDERRNANRRRVYCYRFGGKDISDNMILVPYADPSACAAFVRSNVMVALASLDDGALDSFNDCDVVEIGVFDKRSLRLISHDSPVPVFSIKDVVASDVFSALKKGKVK